MTVHARLLQSITPKLVVNRSTRKVVAAQQGSNRIHSLWKISLHSTIFLSDMNVHRSRIAITGSATSTEIFTSLKAAYLNLTNVFPLATPDAFALSKFSKYSEIKRNFITMKYFSHNNLSFFICAAISCPEVMTRGADCIFQYSPFECCPTEKVCGDQTKKLSECYLEGTRYLEGEMMYPREESCYKCSCQRGFDNSTIRGNPNCYELNCGIELFNLEPLLIDGCSPVFFGTRGCCPISWRCRELKIVLFYLVNKLIFFIYS